MSLRSCFLFAAGAAGNLHRIREIHAPAFQKLKNLALICVHKSRLAEAKTEVEELKLRRDELLQFNGVGVEQSDSFGGFFRRHRIFIKQPAELLFV